MDDDGHIHEISFSIAILVQGGQTPGGTGHRRFFLIQNFGQKELGSATHIQEVDETISVHIPMVWGALSSGRSAHGEEEEKGEGGNLHRHSVPKPHGLVMCSRTENVGGLGLGGFMMTWRYGSLWTE